MTEKKIKIAEKSDFAFTKCVNVKDANLNFWCVCFLSLSCYTMSWRAIKDFCALSFLDKRASLIMFT
jgi:hypothetical protein